MEKTKIIQSNSTTKPISSVQYWDIDENGKMTDNKPEGENAYNLFKKAFKEGQMVYIYHKGEKGDKDHCHFLCRNNTAKGFTNLKTLKNDILCSISKIDNDKYKKGDIVPLHRLNTSNLIDWFGYALHDPKYFEKKGLEFDKEFTYTYNDFFGCPEFLNELILIYEEWLEEEEEKNFFNSYINQFENGKTTLEVIKSVSKFITPDNCASVIKGVEVAKSYALADKSDIEKAFELLTPFIKNNSCLSDSLIDICVVQSGRTLTFNEIAFELFKDYLKKITSNDIITLLLNNGG